MDSKLTPQEAADHVAFLLREGRHKEINNNLMRVADPKRLQEHYDSNNTGENLPMDKRSRLNRAKAMGYNTEKTFWHAGHENKSFSNNQGEIYATESKPLAKAYQKDYDRPYLLPLFSKHKNTINEKKLLDTFKNDISNRNIGIEYGWQALGPEHLETLGGDRRDAARMLSHLKNKGYDSAFFDVDYSPMENADPSSSRAFFYPETLRHTDARFDPRLTHVSDLHASTGGAMGDGGDVEGEGITAYHGSPHDFEQFDTSKIGSGEGNQAYGSGLYFAQNEKVAKNYRDMLAPEVPSEGGTMADAYSLSREQHAMMDQNDLDAHFADIDDNSVEKLFRNGKTTHFFNDGSALVDEGDHLRPIKKGKGHMYEVHINAHPEHFLDWDEVLEDQSDHIKTALRRIADREEVEHGYSDLHDHFDDPYGYTGGAIYDSLSRNGHMSKKASKLLSDAGIKGIRYLDAGSRVSSEEPTHNYVVFDHNHVKVRRKYEHGGEVEEYPLRHHKDWEEAHDYEKTGGKLHYEKPDDYLDEVKPLNMDDDDKDIIHHFKKQMEKGEKLDPVAIYPDGHPNGRHRAHAAKKLGIDKIPVVTWPEKKSAGGPIVERALMIVSKKAASRRGRPE